MPAELGGGGKTTRQSVLVTERKPDYYIGSSGRPTLTSPTVKMQRSSTANTAGDGVRNSKLNKCLYNLAIRDGRVRGTSSASHAAIDGNSRRSCKTESDITVIKPTTGRSSKSPSPMAALSSVSGCPRRFGNGRESTAADRARSVGSPSGWPSSPTSSWLTRSSNTCPSYGESINQVHAQKSGPLRGGGQPIDRAGVSGNRSPAASPPRLLSTRNSMQRASATTSSNRPQGGGLMVSQQCRYSNQHIQLDNRLTYQRSYDRNIFGYNKGMDQFVLPPLQI